MSRDITTSFYFLPRDPRWKKEKPYTLKFVPSKDFLGTNRERVEETGILVQDIRGKESSFSFEINGFAVMELEDYGMTYDDFFDDTKVEGLYLKGLGNQLKRFLKARRVQIFDFVVRMTVKKCVSLADQNTDPEEPRRFPYCHRRKISLQTTREHTSSW